MRVCAELKRRVYWISMYIPDASKCKVAAAKFECAKERGLGIH